MSAPVVDLTDWPENLRKLAALIGVCATRELAAECGGLDNVYIPRTASKGHPWRAVIGDEAWAKVVAEYGGQHLDLPLGTFIGVETKKTAIHALASQGHPNREIARQLHVSERYVRRVVNDVKGITPSRQRSVADPKQLPLFGGKE